MTWPAYETIKVEPIETHLLSVTLNRPLVSNALNTQMGHDLGDLWYRLTVDASDVRCVVLTGAGDRAFCGGADLKERKGMSDETWQRQHEVFERAYWALLDCPVHAITEMGGHRPSGDGAAHHDAQEAPEPEPKTEGNEAISGFVR